jgi:glucose-6-phosphate dehydrogenase assembly protein OpcA
MAYCGKFALQKLKYVVCALLLPGHVNEAWKLDHNKSTFGNQGLSSHTEGAKKKKGKVFWNS